jgi:hypothetical protein
MPQSMLDLVLMKFGWLEKRGRAHGREKEERILSLKT